MKCRSSFAIAIALLGSLIGGLPLAVAQENAAPQQKGKGAGRGQLVDENSKLTNMAVVAVPTTSYVSGDQTITAINDGLPAQRSPVHYGNWPRGGTQWVEYTWSKPISTNKADVYWFTDGAGLQLPKASRLKYFNGTEYVEVPNAKGQGVEGNVWNVTSFDEISTNKIRLEFDAAGGNNISTGINEFRVFDSGKSPAFAPQVEAGIDRLVVVGGKTYLRGAVKQVGGDGTATKTKWAKESGPGDVRFEDTEAAITTAMFSAPGEYVLRLTAGSGDMSASDTVPVRVVEAAAAEHLEPVYTHQYKVSSPLWRNRLKSQIVSWIPHCYTQVDKLDLKEGGIGNLIEAGKKLRGEPAKPHVGYPFSNAWVYNTLESMCLAQMVDPEGDKEIADAQKTMRAKIDEWIPIIIAAQEPDGYLQTRFTLGTARGGSSEHWSPRTRTEHEGYVAGYFLEAAISHYNMTNGQDRRLYDAAKKLADCWYNNIGPAPKKEWYDEHQEMEQALVRFARMVNHVDGPGKGDKYTELAKFLIDSRRGGNQYDQSHLPAVQQYEAVGHAVRAAYFYSAMADIAMMTHDLDYQSAANSIWDNIVNKKYYITGGIGSGETSEGFGPNYSLRNNAYCESCSGTAELFFQYKMDLTYQNAKFADLFEETLFNAILGDTDLEGKNFYYTNALDERRGRQPWHNCPCCVGNIPRTLLMLPTWMYATSPDSLYVNLYAGTTVDAGKVAGTDVQVVQETNYPWDGKVAITVNPKEAKKFAIRLRSPQRSVSDLYTSKPEADGITALTVNGEKITPKMVSGYAVIDREWKAGDKITLELPMVVQRVTCSDKVAANRGMVALKYGPLVYNFEAVDNRDSMDASTLPTLKANSPLTTEWRPDFLEGVMVIKAEAADGKPLLAIPNYARTNRGGRSSVWIRDGKADSASSP